MKIICDNKIPFIKGVFEPYSEIRYLSGAQTTPEIVKDADALITRTRTICNEKLLKDSSVRIIASATIGYDHIDTQYCESNGIKWCNAPGCNSASVAQYIGSVLSVLVGKYKLRFEDLTLGVVGVGNVGSKVAKLASLLGMKVLLNDPPKARSGELAGTVELDELLERSDIVTLHVPLTKSGEFATWHLMDKSRLAKMRPDQILINSSRGAVVDNAALLQVLDNKSIRAAVLDVWEGEPVLNRELLEKLEIGTPHIAGYSTDGKANGTAQSVRAVAAALNLPLTTWKAESLPEPVGGLEFSIDASGKTTQELLTEALLISYDVREDDKRLREHPELFESLRGDYPIRREPTAFNIKLNAANPEQEELLNELGFSIL